jgi:ERF superfamily
MEKSPTISELSKALVNFQKEMNPVSFDATNPFFKSKYVTLSALVSESKDLLAKNGLVVSQLIEDEGSVTTILLHTSGEYLSSKLSLKPVKDDPQGHGSAITYARRYAYASILGIVSDSDDDGNQASSAKPAVSQPQTKTVNRIGGNGEHKPESIRELVMAKSKTKYKTPDEFKVWRIDNGFPEDISKCNDVQLSSMLVQMK